VHIFSELRRSCERLMGYWEKCVLTSYEACVTGLRGSCVIASNRAFSWTSLRFSAILSSRRFLEKEFVLP